MLSLKDLLVVSIEQAVAAPMCTLRLADAGARVIKVEPPGGETARHYDRSVKGESAYFASLNRGKQSIALKLREPDDRALLERIIAQSDIFIRNTAPGSMEQLGLGASTLSAHHPQLIVVDFVGYGQDTECRDMKAYDLLVQAEAGLCAVTGTPESPAKVGVSIADMGTGMNAYAAILEALISRESTGQGAALELAMFDTVSEWMSVPLLHYEYGGEITGRHGMAHASIYPYRPYPCKNGEVVIAVQNNDQWREFCLRVLERPDLANDKRFATNAQRVSNREALDIEIVGVTTDLETGGLIDRLKRAGTAFGRVAELADLHTHPALRRTRVGLNGTVVKTVASPIAQRASGPDLSVPSIDEHGHAIRREFAATEIS